MRSALYIPLFDELADPALVARLCAEDEEAGWHTYLYLPIVAGIVLVAVGDELVVGHPTDDLHASGALVALEAPALFLAGLMACAARIGQAQSVPRAVVVIALLALLAAVSLAVALVIAEQLRGAS